MDVLEDEGAVLAEHLQAVICAVADVDKTILVDTDAVHGVAELLRWRPLGIVGAYLLVARLLAVGAPVALMRTGFAIKYYDPAVGVAGLIVDHHRRCSDGALCLRRALLGGTLARSECARSVHDPNTIISIGSDAGDLS